jgi:CrcB protein
MLNAFTLVAIGGAVGACARFSVSLWLGSAMIFLGIPIAIILCNSIGSFLMGGFLAYSDANSVEAWREPLRLFVAVGLLGGFTTFSTFSLEVFQFIGRKEYVWATAYAGGSVVLSLAAFGLGYYLFRGLSI